MRYILTAELAGQREEHVVMARDDLEAVMESTRHVMKRSCSGSYIWALGALKLRDQTGRSIDICSRFASNPDKVLI